MTHIITNARGGDPEMEALPEPMGKDEMHALARRVLAMSQGDSASVSIQSEATGVTRFARNAVLTASDGTVTSVSYMTGIGTRTGSASTNQLDEASLNEMVRTAEQLARTGPPNDGPPRPMPGPQTYLDAPLWVDATRAAFDPPERLKPVKAAIETARTSAITSAGAIRVYGRSLGVLNTAGLDAYARGIESTFSMTARTEDRKGSGWSGGGWRDWRNLDADRLIDRSIDIAKRMAKPVGVEPGRYTAILEPTALAQMIYWMMGAFDAQSADMGRTPFSLPGGKNKIGLRILDPRLNLVTDPADPVGAHFPFDFSGNALPRTQWIENGVLKTLSVGLGYARRKNIPAVPPSRAVTLSGNGTATLEDMIASTDRGIWVNRFSGLSVVNSRTMMQTGVTRDGCFLIEKGKITKALRNFRFNDSPLFILNSLDMFGPPETGMWGFSPIVVPRVKVRDFAFTSVSEAV